MSHKFMHGTSLLYGNATIPGVPIPKELQDLIPKILQACRDFGLDFYPTVIQMLDHSEISEVAAYGGFPVRYPHWSFGMQYEELQTGFEYNLHKIYEMVVNCSPCYIYCLNSNALVDHVTVIAHATGHNHFFKNNIYFAHTSQNMMNELANHGTRVRRYMSRWGEEKVTEFIDHVLRVETLIDPTKAWLQREIKEPVIKDKRIYNYPRRLNVDPARRHMEEFINPKSWRAKENERIARKEAAEELGIFEKPDKDIVGYIKDNAPLKPWQSDILSMLYEEALYFSPQGMTKTSNEGLACLQYDSLVLTHKGQIPIGEIVENKLNYYVHDGNQLQKIVNWFTHKNKDTIRIVTNRGYIINGSVTHRVINDQYEWKRLDELSIGSKLTLSHHNFIWPEKYQEEIDEDFGSFVGHMMGQSFGFVTGDITQADNYIKIVNKLFGIDFVKKRDDGRWRISAKADICVKEIPKIIMRSPKSVVTAFLRAYFNCDVYSKEHEVVIFISSSKLAEQIQILLLNYGILSNLLEKDIFITGNSALCFYKEFGLGKKQDDKKFFKAENWVDEVVEITYGKEDVYDISVENTHRYVAQGFVNHNSWVDYNIMAKQGFVGLGQKQYDAGIIDYAYHKMGVLGGKYSMNPYKLGFYLLEDIEDRWNKGKFGHEYDACTDLREKEKWDKNLGLGKAKVFEAVKYYDDVGLISEFFTEEFCRKMEFFEWKHYPNGEYKYESADHKTIRKALINKHLNRGLPDIRLTDSNHRGQGSYFLQHFPGEEMRTLYDPYVRDTLPSLRYLAGVDIYLGTYNENGEEIVYICTGTNDKSVKLLSRKQYKRDWGG